MTRPTSPRLNASPYHLRAAINATSSLADLRSSLRRCSTNGPGSRPPVGRVPASDVNGTPRYMGAYDVHAARLIGTVAEKTGIVPFIELVERVMTTEPYASPISPAPGRSWSSVLCP